MKRATTSAAAGVALLLLTGCAGGSIEAETSASPTRAPSATASPTPELTAFGMCKVMEERFLAYPDYVLDIANGDFDTTTHQQYLGWAERLEEAAPADARTLVAKYTDPVHQVQALVEQGGGNLNFQTADYQAGSLEILEYCVDAGYRVDD